MGNKAPVWPSLKIPGSAAMSSDLPFEVGVLCSFAAGGTFDVGTSPASSARLKVLHQELTA